jgi:hypothetical protein
VALTSVDVRACVYESAMMTGRIPLIDDLSRALGVPDDEVRALLRQLAQDHMLVLQPGSGEILMAMPFSAVPTTFEVETGRFWTFGSCVWDAFGVGSMLSQTVRIRTACPCCSVSIIIDTDRVPDDGSIAHFGVPAARWWDDVAFT